MIASGCSLSITGHRPEKIEDIDWVKQAIREVYQALRPKLVIQGMAAGVDLLSAMVALEEGIPYYAVRPWAGHSPRNNDTDLYDHVLLRAERVINVNRSVDYVGPQMYQRRNEWMVDHSEAVLAVWDGSKGGTANCVKYALRQGKPLIRVNPRDGSVTYPEAPEQEEPTLF